MVESEEFKHFNSIVDAVCYWLGYQSKIGRAQLIHEASLRYPIADAITSDKTSIQRVVLELLHPLFMSKKIDLVIYEDGVTNPKAEKDDNKVRDVYEFKLAKEDTSKLYKEEHQRVFDDVARLAYYNKWGNKECYFLMCGTYSNFKVHFVGQSSLPPKVVEGKATAEPRKVQKPVDSHLLIDEWTPAGLYKDWFDFRIGKAKTKTFKIPDSGGKNWGLKPFQDSYHVRNNSKHCYDNILTIKTTCMAITPYGQDFSRTHAAGIWKIEFANS